MVEAQKPRESPPNYRIKFALLLMGFIRITFIILLIVSGLTIISEYYRVCIGNLPTEIQKIRFDWSLKIFVGSSLFLLVYTRQVKDSIMELFNVPKCDKTRTLDTKMNHLIGRKDENPKG